MVGLAAASARRKAQNPPLLPPIVRQISGQRDQPRRRQLDGVLAGQDAADDFRGEIGETHENRQMIAPDAEPRRHGVDAVVAARDKQVARCDGPSDERGETVIDRICGCVC